MATVVIGGVQQFYSPAELLAKQLSAALADALDPRKASSAVKTWADMTAEERAAISRRLMGK